MELDLTNLSIEQLKLLNKISVDIHDDFNNLTEMIFNASNKSNVDLLGNILSRHPYQSNLYDICINLKFINQCIENNNDITKILTNDYDLYKILKTIKNKYKVELINYSKFKYIIYNYLKPVIDIFKNLKSIFYFTISKNTSRKCKIMSLDSAILIDTFILQNSFHEKKFIDRYYTRILNYTDNDLTRKIFFLPHIIGNFSRKNLSDIFQKSNENILFKHDFLKIYDYLITIFLLFKQGVKNGSPFYFHGYNLSNLINNSINRERFHPSTFYGLLNYFFIKRLKEDNINIELFIDWNENQPIDKGLVLGVHKFYPNVKIKGYRAFIISYDYNLYLMPTQLEVDKKLIPDEIVVIGDGLKPEITKFCNKIKVSSGPAFRFMSIYESSEKQINNNILVALPIGFDDSIDIIKTLYSIREYFNSKPFKILVKPHPTTSLEKLIKEVTNYWFPCLLWVEGSFKENVLQSWLFISNTSSAIMEALAYGVPVIIIGSKTSITQNPIPRTVNNKIWRLIFTSDELVDTINYFANLSNIEKLKFKEIGNDIKLNYFKPVTRESVLEFFKK